MLVSRTNERDSQITKKSFNSGTSTKYHREFSSLVFVCDFNCLAVELRPFDAKWNKRRPLSFSFLFLAFRKLLQIEISKNLLRTFRYKPSVQLPS